MNTDIAKNTNSLNDDKKSNREQRDYAVVLYGATSFVGQITAHYLAEFLSTNKDKGGNTVTWAIAGRDEEKLNELQSKLASKVDIGYSTLNTATLLFDFSITILGEFLCFVGLLFSL